LSPEAGKVPIPAGLGPTGAVLRDDPRLVLGGGAQVGQELLASPVISSFFAGTDAVTPPTVVAKLRHLQLELLDGRVAEDGPLQQELRL